MASSSVEIIDSRVDQEHSRAVKVAWNFGSNFCQRPSSSAFVASRDDRTVELVAFRLNTVIDRQVASVTNAFDRQGENADFSYSATSFFFFHCCHSACYYQLAIINHLDSFCGDFCGDFGADVDFSSHSENHLGFGSCSRVHPCCCLHSHLADAQVGAAF